MATDREPSFVRRPPPRALWMTIAVLAVVVVGLALHRAYWPTSVSNADPGELTEPVLTLPADVPLTRFVDVPASWRLARVDVGEGVDAPAGGVAVDILRLGFGEDGRGELDVIWIAEDDRSFVRTELPASDRPSLAAVGTLGRPVVATVEIPGKRPVRRAIAATARHTIETFNC